MRDELLQLLFPSGLLDYFAVTSIENETSRVSIYLEEKNIIPKGYDKRDMESKGFFNEETISDFPLRGKACCYKLKRRKWKEKSSGKVIYRDWNLVAKGTRITKEFATFLKGIN